MVRDTEMVERQLGDYIGGSSMSVQDVLREGVRSVRDFVASEYFGKSLPDHQNCLSSCQLKL